MTILAVGVIIHKIPVSCAVGSTFISNNQTLQDKMTVAVFIFFILASPIGMGIGMAIGESNHDTPLLSILQALSGGTFVYLACCDLLVHEFHSQKPNIAHENDEDILTQQEIKKVLR